MAKLLKESIATVLYGFRSFMQPSSVFGSVRRRRSIDERFEDVGRSFSRACSQFARENGIELV